MRSNDSKNRLSTLAALVGCSLLLAWCLWPKVAVWNQQRIATYLAAEIEAADDDKVRVPLRQLASLGTVALHPLVGASASERTAVAELARQIIDEQFDFWHAQAKASRHFDIATPAAELADALASHIDDFGPRGKQWAENLAIHLIVLTETVPASKAPQLLKDCTRILASVSPAGLRLRNMPTTSTQTPSSFPSPTSLPSVPITTLAVPSERVIHVPASAGSSISPQATTLRVTPNNIFSDPRTVKQLQTTHDSSWSPEWNTGGTSSRAGSSEKTVPMQPLTPQPLSAMASNRRVVDIPSPAEMDQQIKRLRQKTSQNLVSLLPRGDIFDDGPIRAVLRERGFTDAEMNLTNQYSSAKVGDRLKLIDDLSVVPAATARRWLHWLLEDKSAEVRLRALTAIATTTDPTLFKVARRLAIYDKDPRIAKLATQIMRDTRK